MGQYDLKKSDKIWSTFLDEDEMHGVDKDNPETFRSLEDRMEAEGYGLDYTYENRETEIEERLTTRKTCYVLAEISKQGFDKTKLTAPDWAEYGWEPGALVTLRNWHLRGDAWREAIKAVFPKMWDGNKVNESPEAFATFLIEAVRAGASKDWIAGWEPAQAFFEAWPALKDIINAVETDNGI